MHSSVTGALPPQPGMPSDANQQPTYKTNTLDQYGGRNSALNNINAIVGSSVMGGTTAHYYRNHASNQSANMIKRSMAGINMMNYSIL